MHLWRGQTSQTGWCPAISPLGCALLQPIGIRSGCEIDAANEADGLHTSAPGLVFQRQHIPTDVSPLDCRANLRLADGRNADAFKSESGISMLSTCRLYTCKTSELR